MVRVSVLLSFPCAFLFTAWPLAVLPHHCRIHFTAAKVRRKREYGVAARLKYKLPTSSISGLGRGRSTPPHENRTGKTRRTRKTHGRGRKWHSRIGKTHGRTRKTLLSGQDKLRQMQGSVSDTCLLATGALHGVTRATVDRRSQDRPQEKESGGLSTESRPVLYCCSGLLIQRGA